MTALAHRSLVSTRRPSIHDAHWIGFDLDHALVRYRLGPLMELIHDMLGNFLVEHKGYPADVILQPFDRSLCAKGMIFDTATGNVLMVDTSGRVTRSVHGTRVMTTDEILSTWKDGIWPGIVPLRSQTKHESFMLFITYFDMPVVPIIMRIVQYCDSVGRSYNFIPDLIAAFNHHFDPIAYEIGRGEYFPALVAHPEKYLVKRDSLKQWMLKKKSEGTRFWLATNSHVGYGTFLLEHCFGVDWKACFDVALFNCLKPGFFTRIHPFFTFDTLRRTEGVVAAQLVLDGPDLCQGNATAVQRLATAVLRHGPGVTIELDAFGAVVTPETPLPASSMVTIGPEHSSAVGLASSISLGMLDASEDPLDSSAVAASMSPVTPAKALIAYVGDHLHGDVLAAKRFGWITVAIVEEMEVSMPAGSSVTSHDPATVGTLPPEYPTSQWGDFFAAPSALAGCESPYFANLLESIGDVVITDAALLPCCKTQYGCGVIKGG